MNHPPFIRCFCCALWAVSAGCLSAATTLTFATTGNTGVSGTSGDIILANNPNASKMLASGTTPFAANPTYGSNVAASSANNGAYLVTGTATPDIALAWSANATGGATNIIEGIGKSTAGWGDVSGLANNGLGQVNNFIAGSSISIAFTPTAGKGVLIQSLDFYKSNLNLTANTARAYTITVTGNGSPATSYTGTFVQSAVAEGISTFSFGGGVLGKPGEVLTLTLSRPTANATELTAVQAALGSTFTVYTQANQTGIDNLTFSEITEAQYAVDTDGDGLGDLAETYTYHTNPLLKDTDGDGIPDGVEVNTTLTDPNSNDSRLVYYLLKQAGGPPVALRNAQTGALTFQLNVSHSSDLATGWTSLPLTGPGITAAPAGASLSIGIPAPGFNKHFYRFVIPQP